MKIMKRNNAILLFIIFIITASCNKNEKNNNLIIDSSAYSYFISNEGAFGYSNASVSIFNSKENSVINNAFEQINNRNLGDVLQSIYKIDSKLFLMVNASNKIEVVDSKSMKQIKTLENISLPRYMISDGNKNAYVSCWGNDGLLKVLDINSLEFTESIKVGKGPEEMLISNNKLYVCNRGGFVDDSTISIVNIFTNKLIKNLKCNFIPIDIVAEDDYKIWVLCRGKIIYNAAWQQIGESKASLICINTNSDSIEKELLLPANQHPSHLEISPDKSILFYGGGFSFNGIYSFKISSNVLSTNPLINKEFYGFNVHPTNGDIFCLEAPSFSSSGRLIIYSSTGVEKQNLKCGIGPNSIIF